MVLAGLVILGAAAALFAVHLGVVVYLNRPLHQWTWWQRAPAAGVVVLTMVGSIGALSWTGWPAPWLSFLAWTALVLLGDKIEDRIKARQR
jgi:hypothetical protein